MTRYSRRRFLEDSMFAAAAMAATGATRVVAAKPQADSPNEKLSVALVGSGGRGSDHLGAFSSRSDTEIIYICDADETRGQKACEVIEKRGRRRPKFVRDMREAFDDKSLDIVTTATPNHWHALVAIWAMQAGKDVYVEKPVSHNVSEGRRMVEAARKYNRICQTGTQCRSMKGTIDAIEFVQAGKIGEVRLARGLCYKRRKEIGPKGDYEVPKEVDYDLWSGPAQVLPLTRPKFHYDWHWQREYGNGDQGNQGPHQMDIARWGLGVNRICDTVISYGGRLGYEDAGDVANTQISIYEFKPEGKTLVFEVRGLETAPFAPHAGVEDASIGVIFYGSEGYVVLTSYHHGAAFDLDGKQIATFSGSGDHYDNFVQAVRSRNHEDLTADILEGHLSCAHSHLGNVSYYLGQQATAEDLRSHLANVETSEDTAATLDRVLAHLGASGVDLGKTPLTLGPQLVLDPEAETVTNNTDAVALLTREYRAPYVVPPAGQV
jgi:predicted dehydrogenase